ncbi:MAG TPA: hypothetical protein VF668_21465 [Pyrinomonadaceae bacterium]|jgi:hypothetical protein
MGAANNDGIDGLMAAASRGDLPRVEAPPPPTRGSVEGLPPRLVSRPPGGGPGLTDFPDHFKD